MWPRFTSPLPTRDPQWPASQLCHHLHHDSPIRSWSPSGQSCPRPQGKRRVKPTLVFPPEHHQTDWSPSCHRAQRHIPEGVTKLNLVAHSRFSRWGSRDQSVPASPTGARLGVLLPTQTLQASTERAPFPFCFAPGTRPTGYLHKYVCNRHENRDFFWSY